MIMIERRSPLMDVKVGDRITVDSGKVGQAPRSGEVLEIIEAPYGNRYRVRWDDGHESTFHPTSGTIHTVEREPKA
jgi:hypothetical protein